MNIPRSADEPTSATAFFHGLPVSVRTMSPNSRSFSRSSAAARPSTSPRRGGGTRPQGRRAPDILGRSARNLRDHAVVDRTSLVEGLRARRRDLGLVYPVKDLAWIHSLFVAGPHPRDLTPSRRSARAYPEQDVSSLHTPRPPDALVPLRSGVSRTGRQQPPHSAAT